MNTVARGAVAGLAGTAAHSAVMAGGKATGLMQTPPPKEITANLLEKSGIDETPSGPGFTAAWTSNHVAYGVGTGILYDLIRPMLPASPTVAGLLFGGAVWAASYFKLMPELGLHPSVEEDSKSRQLVMVLAHAAYGVALAEADDRLRGEQDGANGWRSS
jgi:putative membrane protein